MTRGALGHPEDAVSIGPHSQVAVSADGALKMSL